MIASSLTILIPVFNEAPTVARAIERILDMPPPHDLERKIIAVDDGSTDGSGEILKKIAENHEEVTVLAHERNKGKGAALRMALVHVNEQANADLGGVVLIHDADLEYDPADHKRLLEPIINGRADAVVGSRFRGGTSHRVLYYWHSVANRIVTTLCNAVTNLNLSDIECCNKAFTGEVAQRLKIQENRFGVEPELVAKLSRLQLDGGKPVRVYEVPVSYAGRTYEEGKKIGARDGLWAVWCIVKYGVGRW